MKRLHVLLLAFLCVVAGCTFRAKAVTTVILVRHAEKVTTPGANDPPLTAAGQARARELARVVGSAGIDAIYVTPFTRTRQTAAPLAGEKGVKPIEIDAGKSYPEQMARRIRAEHSGQTVLVVGHSDTTPDVIRALGVANPPTIADSEYDDLFIVTFGAGSEPRLLTLRYGAPAR